MDRQTKKTDDLEIDLKRLIDAILSKAVIIAIVAILCAVVTFMGTFFFIKPKYQSSAVFYVNNNALSLGDASFSLSTGDISAAKSLVNSYIVILKTRTTLNDVIEYAEVKRTYSELQSMISAASVSNTEIFRIIVTSEDPVEAERIANAIAYILPKRISSIIEGTSAKIVDTAIVPTVPSSPNYTKNTMVGFLAGLALTALVIILREIFNIAIRTEDDIARCCNHPVLAAVPDMTAPSKGGYYGYGEKKRISAKRTSELETPILVGSEINFAASEAYKLLRTKIQYSFAGDKTCRVIGVSSALTGEGKSLTAVNLAYTLSQLNTKVLLIDCDMRRPSLPDKLPIQKKPGLSGFLSGQAQEQTMFQFCGIPGEEQAFHVIAAGQIPPNPVELLSSSRMSAMLKQLREMYDYIILDLPPVGEVSDALAVVNEVDGFLLVVRQNYCNRLVLSDAIRQFEFVNSRILGVAYNCATESGKGYGNKYYKKYYNKYYNDSAAQKKTQINSKKQ